MKKAKRRLCKECGEAKPLRAFYRGRGVCRKCILGQARRAYLARTRFHEGEFICRRCGKVKPASHLSVYAADLCKSCHAFDLLSRKAAAPEMLKCRSCGETKPKELFAKYSVTRCRSCAVRAVIRSGKGRRYAK